VINNRIHRHQDRLREPDIAGRRSDSGEREGVTTLECERLKARRRQVKELCRANEILKLPSAFFA
jgi:hypothetical protein